MASGISWEEFKRRVDEEVEKRNIPMDEVMITYIVVHIQEEGDVNFKLLPDGNAVVLVVE